MNHRQRKKQYKKKHGYNPPKGWEPTTSGEALRKGRTTMTDQDIENMVTAIKAVCGSLTDAMANIAEGFSRALANIAENLRAQQALEPLPEPQVLLAEALSERRKERCRRNGWKASKRLT